MAFKFKEEDYVKEFPYVQSWWFKVLNHWVVPFGNYHEPLPFPEKRMEEAKEFYKKYKVPVYVYWIFRNFLHNFTHFWIGITPLGRRYEWRSPGEEGWVKGEKYWHNKVWPGNARKRRRFGVDGHLYGWQSRGSFRLGRKDND